MDSSGQVGPTFQDVNENAEHRNPGGPESHTNIPDDDRRERGSVIPGGHVITAEPPLDPPANPQPSRPPTKTDHKSAVASIRGALRMAATGLKAAPIDRMIGALLLLIETYEEVCYPAILPGALSDSMD